MEKTFIFSEQTAKFLNIHTEIDTIVSDTFKALENFYGPDIDKEFASFLDCMTTAQAELRRFISENIKTSLWDSVNTEKDQVVL